jgi:hypothetical protein
VQHHDITLIKGVDLERTINEIEQKLVRMDVFLRNIPAPCLLYSTKDIILWYNHPAEKVLFGHNGRLLPHATRANILNQHVQEVLTEHAAQYIIEKNAEVRRSGLPQYDEYSPEEVPESIWKCLRFPVETTRVGVILLPSEDYVTFFDK